MTPVDSDIVVTIRPDDWDGARSRARLIAASPALACLAREVLAHAEHLPIELVEMAKDVRAVALEESYA